MNWFTCSGNLPPEGKGSRPWCNNIASNCIGRFAISYSLMKTLMMFCRMFF